MSNDELIAEIRARAQGLEYSMHWLILEAVRRLESKQAAEKNEPLTLDELRQMEGEPVWVDHWHGGEWIIVYWDYVRRIAYTRKACLHEHEYGETWIAYRRKPEEN